MIPRRARLAVLGFLGAALILGVLFWLVGTGRIVAELRAASPRYVGVAFLAVLGWLFAWGLALRTVLGGLGVGLSRPRSFLVFAGAMCANNVTPFGQAGGEPITALLLTDAVEVEYERGLAAIASVDALNFLPSMTLAALGLAYYATLITFGRKLRLVSGAVVGLGIAVPAVLVLGWRYRGRVERALSGGLASLLGWLNAHLPRTIEPAAIRERVRGFFGAIERVGTNRRRLGLAIAYSGVGWLCHVLALWAAFRAIGAPVPVLLLFFVVPVGSMAGVTPLPGGLGGIESVLVGVLAALGIASATAASAVVIYRGLIYWVPTVLGGGVILALRIEGR